MSLDTIADTIRAQSGRVLNVYFTAGYPTRDSSAQTIVHLSDAGVDLIELGMPYSDPLADGETIQHSSQVALEQGMHLDLLLAQVAEARVSTQVPIILMGYYNQVLQYGLERFLHRAAEVGIQGMILPDLPMDEYAKSLQAAFEERGIAMSFLITPATSAERVRQADALSTAFVYMVSHTSITGGARDIQAEQVAYFDRIAGMNLKRPRLIGFGIHDRETYMTSCEHSDGAIIGSAFIKHLGQSGASKESIERFVRSIR